MKQMLSAYNNSYILLLLLLLLFLIMSKSLWTYWVVFSKNDGAEDRLWWELDQFGSGVYLYSYILGFNQWFYKRFFQF